MSESLDDLAAFLMHRTLDPDLPEAARLAVFVLVEAYQEGDAPDEVAAGLRRAAAPFHAHPDYRPEWRVTEDDGVRLAENPLLFSTVVGPEPDEGEEQQVH